MNTLAIVIIAAAAIALAIVAAYLFKRARTKQLQSRFGPEYERALQAAGNRSEAEKELEARRKRVASFSLRPLTEEEQARFGKEWQAAQARFVDDPKTAVADAHRLVKEVMQARGYPMGDFDQRAADISVDHPLVVSNYRTAREIAERSSRGKASTEEMRQAVVCYRALFEELLETRELVPA
jgi:hypothetical protein